VNLKNKITSLLFFATAVLTFGCNQSPEKTGPNENGNTINEPVKVPKQKAVDKNVLLGDWVRTDAEYRVEIAELLNEGRMKAGYFNPKSIHVEKAMWAFDGGLFKIYIELKDENYPGSNYELTYIPGKDLLAGKYFQAVEGTTYDVAFVRKK
jgi:hypothetical protein